MLRVMSTFSGISAASVAWKPLGMEFVAYSEVDSFACHVLSTQLGVSRPKYLPSAETMKMTARQYRNYVKSFDDLPIDGIPNFGDITQITNQDLKKLGRVDVLEGGAPCQAFSFAGLRGGLSDHRGNLTLVFCKLAERMRKINQTDFVIFENVKGILSDEKEENAFGCLLGALARAGRPIQPPGSVWGNSGLIFRPEGHVSGSVSWRVLCSQYFDVPQRRQRLYAVANFSDRDGSASAILIDEASKDRFVEPRKKEVKELVSKTSGSAFRVAEKSELIHPNTVGTLLASGAGMSRMAGIGSELDFVIVQKIDGQTIARRLHPVECERLQGFPDNWTNVEFKGKPAKDSDRYRTIGNSMAVPCMRFIGIGLVDYVERKKARREPRNPSL